VLTDYRFRGGSVNFLPGRVLAMVIVGAVCQALMRGGSGHDLCAAGWLWVDATGKRLRRSVTGPAKTAVLEAVAELREELGSARR